MSTSRTTAEASSPLKPRFVNSRKNSSSSYSSPKITPSPYSRTAECTDTYCAMYATSKLGSRSGTNAARTRTEHFRPSSSVTQSSTRRCAMSPPRDRRDDESTISSRKYASVPMRFLRCLKRPGNFTCSPLRT